MDAIEDDIGDAVGVEEAVGGAQRWEHPSAYVRHFRELVSLTVENQAALFTAKELRILGSFLSLDEAAQCLFSRLIMRQGPWLRVDKLSNCFPKHMLSTHNEDVAETSEAVIDTDNDTEERAIALLFSSIIALEQNTECPFLLSLTASMPWLDGWHAMGSCLTVDEMKEIYYKLTLKKAKGPRDVMLNDIFQHMNTSTDLFRRPLPLVNTIHSVLAAKFAASTQPNKTKGYRKIDSTCPLIVRVPPDVCALFRRAQRLMQVPSMLSVYGHGRAASVRYPLPFNAAVLTIYGKIRFCDYKINVTRPIFLGKKQFTRWEAAHELKWAFHEYHDAMDQAMSFVEASTAWAELQGDSSIPKTDLKLSTTLNFQLRNIINVVVASAAEFQGCETDDVDSIKYVLSNAGLLCKQGEVFTANVIPLIQFAICLCVVLTWQSYIADNVTSKKCALEQDYMKSIDAGAILASLCSEAVDIFEAEARRVGKSKAAISSTDEVVKSLSLTIAEDQASLWWSEEQLLSFMKPLNENSIFSYIVAIEILRSLLRNSFLVHRRGKWIERLCIDLEHLGSRKEALEECLKGLQDPHIEGGHRITIEKKAASLFSKLSKNATSNIETSGVNVETVGNIDVDNSDQSDDDFTSENKKNRVKSKKRKRASNVQATTGAGGRVSERYKKCSVEDRTLSICDTSAHIADLNSESALGSQTSLAQIVQALLDNSTTITKKSKAISGDAINDDDEIVVISSEQYYCDKRARSTDDTPNQPSAKKKRPTAKNASGSKVDLESKSIAAVAEEWSCRVCTLLNTTTRATCEVCGSTRIGINSTTSTSIGNKIDTGFIRTLSVQSSGTPSGGFFERKGHNIATIPSDTPKSNKKPSGSSCIPDVGAIDSNDMHSSAVCEVERSDLAMDTKGAEGEGLGADSSPEPLPLLSALWGDTINPPRGWKSDVLELTGRRLGSKRKGKSLLLGLNGDAVAVEDLVLQMLGADERDIDETIVRPTLEISPTELDGGVFYPNLYTGGNWRGWHCEGSPLRTLFGLIMWEILFLDTVENVFYTPYQDQPLDLQYGAVFYKNREKEIKGRFEWLENSNMSAVLEDLSRTYRKYYKCRCISVSWVHPLHIIQAIALGMKGNGLIALCKLMLSNFRHFQGGAPDLLLLRGYRRLERNSVSDDRLKDGVAIEFVDIDKWLGPEWQRLGRPMPGQGWGRWKSGKKKASEEDWNNLINVSALDANFERSPTALEDSESNLKSGDGNGVSSLLVHQNSRPAIDGDPTSPTKICVEVDRPIEVDVDYPEPELSTAVEGNESKISVRKQFVYTGLDLANPGVGEAIDRDLNAQFECYEWVDDWVFECIFVEVKGPTDHLADRQAVWLHTLCQSGNSGGGGAKALVCQIREGRNGQDTGHHESMVDDD